MNRSYARFSVEFDRDDWGALDFWSLIEQKYGICWVDYEYQVVRFDLSIKELLKRL